MNNDVELVVLADEHGRPAGTAPKATVHSEDTPLHFAFSAFLLDDRGRLLMTRRALSKKTWPGVWTNSFCGHPGPGEDNADALRRRAVQELGYAPDAIADIAAALPDFRYRAVDASGVVEWEICPVFVARLAPGAQPTPNPDEIEELAWVQPRDLLAAVDATPFAFSPWLIEELARPELREALR